MSPTNQQPAPVARHFFRCCDCLTVAAVDSLPRKPLCGLCDGRMIYMGQVKQARLTQSEERCACDDRCICARGPICNCKCGGKYHGQGMLAPVVTVTRDCGPVPVIKMANNRKAQQTANEWRTALARLKAEAEQLLAQRDSNGRLDSANYLRMIKLQNVARKATRSKQHTHRMKLIYSVIAAPVAEPIAPRVPIAEIIAAGPITSTGPRRQLSLI